MIVAYEFLQMDMQKTLSILGEIFAGIVFYGLVNAIWAMVLTALNNANSADPSSVPSAVVAVIAILYMFTPWIAGIRGGYKAYKFLMRKLEPKVTPPPTN
jgi:Na+/proline symporter